MTLVGGRQRKIFVWGSVNFPFNFWQHFYQSRHSSFLSCIESHNHTIAQPINRLTDCSKDCIKHSCPTNLNSTLNNEIKSHRITQSHSWTTDRPTNWLTDCSKDYIKHSCPKNLNPALNNEFKSHHQILHRITHSTFIHSCPTNSNSALYP